MTKPKEYEKPIMQIIAELKYLCKCLHIAMTTGRDVWDTISIIIALDLLYEDFYITTVSLLETNDKIIDQIQSILQLKKAKNLNKRATRDTGDLAMAFQDKCPKGKVNSNDEYYNCHKFGHIGRDCFLPDKRLNRNTKLSQREKFRKGDTHRGRGGTQGSTPNQAHQAVENKSAKHDDNSDLELFTPRPIGISCMITEGW